MSVARQRVNCSLMRDEIGLGHANFYENHFKPDTCRSHSPTLRLLLGELSESLPHFASGRSTSLSSSFFVSNLLELFSASLLYPVFSTRDPYEQQLDTFSSTLCVLPLNRNWNYVSIHDTL